MSFRIVAVSALIVCTLGFLAVPEAKAEAPRGASPEAAKLYRDYPVIELVTMGVGALIWERHGHIALCVRYANHHRDVCYNYGTGNFAHPVAMGWGFFRGDNSFWVAKQPRDRLLNIYRGADRSVWVQPLPLTAEQKQKVIDKLEFDILEENKFYSYDHFWDNCTTRVRDVIDDATNRALSSMKNPPGDETFRELARKGFYGMRIPLLITDTAMGRATDRIPTFYERMFLPDYMRAAVTELWHIEPIPEYVRKGKPPDDDGPSGRIWLALFIVLVTAPAWLTRLLGRFERAGLAFSLALPLLLGLGFWTLAIISPLPYVRYNESCLIFFPLDILLVAFLSVEHRRLYARGRVAMLAAVALLLLVGVLKQPLMAPLLWPLIPAATVGFWPDKWSQRWS